ncbi:tRNA (N6-isopentenyl adenosine(37)-C2)-methylthiotransferase MiaB [Oceanotoga teriensis]|uniref:tRNA (N6-isopentenyl adenosine(37)-C2)-methylthiotransferase MiaB n=1 Tax=Oceanotoga teriensis TaxID=515440 RepID=UPI0027141B87|nr:tRNA (N6-isopentenyl adenosine(37)-C2)-methylthiotransferase MiaB [Oceanotoga teriensis]MDO7975600.1 tRNA (N6-isopentenyl adenosine(37)-C2)-methylthiotransferase MiaB [Oceanotoga teriensis]
MKFYIKTFGCQMNVNESEIMSGLLTREGYEWTENPENANLIILNTCAVREKAENKMHGAIGEYGKFKNKNKDLILAVGGCSSEKERDEILKRHKKVNFIFGTRNVVDIVNMVNRAKRGEKFSDFSDKLSDMSHDLPKMPNSLHHAWVTIQYGCNKYCSYCIVPYTRGFEKSRDFEDIINEVKDYAKKGYREITFLGQNVDSYGKDFGDGKPKLDKLIKEAAKVEGIERIWFMTSYPSDITDELIDTIAKEPKAANYFHLPVQAGSNNMLEAMNRKYTKEQFYKLVHRVRSKVKGVTLSTDIIVGFPGETHEDYLETLQLIKDIRFEKVNIAEYSPREGTIAAKFKEDNVSKEEKNKRLMEIVEIEKNIGREENEKYAEKIIRVIQEGKTKHGMHFGRTINNKVVMFDSIDEYNGKYVDVKIRRVSAGPLYGQKIADETQVDFKKEDPTLKIFD